MLETSVRVTVVLIFYLCKQQA